VRMPSSGTESAGSRWPGNPSGERPACASTARSSASSTAVRPSPRGPRSRSPREARWRCAWSRAVPRAARRQGRRAPAWVAGPTPSSAPSRRPARCWWWRCSACCWPTLGAGWTAVFAAGVYGALGMAVRVWRSRWGAAARHRALRRRWRDLVPPRRAALPGRLGDARAPPGPHGARRRRPRGEPAPVISTVRRAAAVLPLLALAACGSRATLRVSPSRGGAADPPPREDAGRPRRGPDRGRRRALRPARGRDLQRARRRLRRLRRRGAPLRRGGAALVVRDMEGSTGDCVSCRWAAASTCSPSPRASSWSGVSGSTDRARRRTPSRGRSAATVPRGEPEVLFDRNVTNGFRAAVAPDGAQASLPSAGASVRTT
jgi:hypothetical protein